MSVYVIAEVGVNHNGQLDLAEQMIRVAAAAGADAVKFQTFSAERLVTKTAPRASYQEQNCGDSDTQFEMLRRLELTPEDFAHLKWVSANEKIEFLSTPFDEESVDVLVGLVDRFKIASGDITTEPLLKRIAQTKKPIILSTGMSHLGEIEAALSILEGNGSSDITILHCTSNYPCAPSNANLRSMVTIAEAFGRPVGYSDHTLGVEAAITAVALGASVLEKHFTLDRTLPGPDHKASLTPEELNEYIRAVRTTEALLGDRRKMPTDEEKAIRLAARKSLVWARDVQHGTVVVSDFLKWKRPGTGIPTSSLSTVLGKRTRRPVLADTLVSLADFEPED